jgi:amino acid transporter
MPEGSIGRKQLSTPIPVAKVFFYIGLAAMLFGSVVGWFSLPTGIAMVCLGITILAISFGFAVLKGC